VRDDPLGIPQFLIPSGGFLIPRDSVYEENADQPDGQN
jgi:hypothetical protein